MTKITNETQLNRAILALAETACLITKEKSYREDLQKQDYLASLKSHANKVNAMIEEYRERFE